jgi:hypothetical protein
MKHLSIFNKNRRSENFRLSLLIAGILLLPACAQDEGPSIDDHFLNYEIGEIPLTADCPVGVYYFNSGSGGQNPAIYARLTAEPNPANGAVGPYVKPLLGNYTTAVSDESVTVVQQHVDWCIESRIDFLILQGCQENPATLYPGNIAPGDTTFYNLVTGRMGSDGLPKAISAGKTVDMKSLKYVLSINMDRINDGLTYTNLIEYVPTTVKEGVEMTRIERFNEFYKRLSDYFSDPNYYRVNNKPLVVVLNAQRLYSEKSADLYDNMRAYVKAHCGDDMFLVAQQDPWSPPARFQYFYINGKVDAVTHRNMYNQGTYDRSYWYPQAIDQNWIYSREFFMNHWSIDYVPTVAPSFNQYVYSGANYNMPIVPKKESTFRTLCNVAKKNLGKTRMVFIDSFNQWQYDTALEPADPEYGNGYGMTYLNIVGEQFKK